MTTFILEQDKMERLSADCRKLIEKEKGGCDVRTILKDMYCDAYSDKTENIGYVMADKVIGLVGEYDQEVRQAMENQDAWYDEKVQKILEGKNSATARCNTLYKVRVGLIAAGISAEEGRDASQAYVEEHSHKAFTADEATEELEAKLKDELKTALGNNGFLASVLDAYADRAANTTENIEFTVVKYGEDSSKFKAVLAMKAYLETGEDGYLKGVMPENASLRDITYSVCAGTDTMSVAGAVESGEIEESAASRIVRTIGMVIGAVVAVYASVSAGILVASYIGGGILAFIGGITIALGVSEVITDSLIDAGGSLAEITKDVVCFGAKCVRFAGRMLFSGIKKLIGLIGGIVRGRATEDEIDETDGMIYTEPTREGGLERESEAAVVPTVLA